MLLQCSTVHTEMEVFKQNKNIGWQMMFSLSSRAPPVWLMGMINRIAVGEAVQSVVHFCESPVLDLAKPTRGRISYRMRSNFPTNSSEETVWCVHLKYYTLYVQTRHISTTRIRIWESTMCFCSPIKSSHNHRQPDSSRHVVHVWTIVGIQNLEEVLCRATTWWPYQELHKSRAKRRNYHNHKLSHTPSGS